MSEQNSLKREFKWLSIRHLKRKPREIDRKGRGAVVASVKRNGGRRKELQKAEYRNRKKGMATGRTEEEERGSRKANGQHRRNRRQGRTGRREKKDGRLSSQNRGSADERKPKQRRSESGKEAAISCGMDGPEKAERQG